MPDSLPFGKDAKPDLPKPGKRKALTRVQILQIAIRQKLLCGCGCGAPLNPECIDEHMVPRETLPADRCDHIDNRALLNIPCAKSKTVKDQAVIGHWRRARGDSGQLKRLREKGPVLKSRNSFAQSPLLDTPPRRNPKGWQKPEGYISPLSKKSKGYRKMSWSTRAKPARASQS